jgi:hypothetical protein
MNEQQKNIKKTVLMIVAIMVTILALFFNKITTPRYLSTIELKINGLEFLDPKTTAALTSINNELWLLVASDDEDKQLLENLHSSLKNSLQKKVQVVDRAALALDAEILKTRSDRNKKIIPIIRPSGEYAAYFTAPFDSHKMILTLSSIVTHR